jgi:hypothetical protein
MIDRRRATTAPKSGTGNDPRTIPTNLWITRTQGIAPDHVFITNLIQLDKLMVAI